MPIESLQEALNILEKPLFRPEKGDYAALVDEADEQGAVNVYRQDGTPVLQMPRAVWDQIRKEQVF